MIKRTASLSLDLDNKWSYMKTHGDKGWESYPSYFGLVVPRILDFLKLRDLTITFFIVGQDAALEKNHKALRSLADAGHEIANHSFKHEPWLHLYSEQEIDKELENAEIAIEQATGKKTRGFRGPGFSISEATLKVLLKRGYDYDCTAFPNLLNPLARMYFFATSNLTKEEKEQRKALFGSASDALRPVKPYRWALGDKTLTEVPVTTMPWFKIPIHFSYVLYLSTYSTFVARLYFKFSLFMCKLTGTEPSLLLHPLDFMGDGDDKDLAFFPAMRTPTEKKMELMAELVDYLQNHYNIVSMAQHVEKIEQGRPLKNYQPTFNHSKNTELTKQSG